MTRKMLDAFAVAASVVFLALVFGPGAAAVLATPTTQNVTWHLPVGVNPETDPYEAWFPQTLDAPAACGWTQTDRYPIGPETDAVLADGRLTIDAYGRPEDADIVQAATFATTCTQPGYLAQTGIDAAHLAAGICLLAAGLLLYLLPRLDRWAAPRKVTR